MALSQARLFERYRVYINVQQLEVAQAWPFARTVIEFVVRGFAGSTAKPDGNSRYGEMLRR